MTKRPDQIDDAGEQATEFEEGMTTAERRRRKRRAASLRVPSDNVPRRPSEAMMSPPVPEDPNLAMSIAYSFSSDASGAVSVPHAAPHVVAPGLAPVAPEAAATVPSASFAGMSSTPVDGIAPGDDDDDLDVDMSVEQVSDSDHDPEGFETVTREMAAVDLEALGLSAPGSSNAADGSGSSMPGMVPNLSALAASGVVLGPIPGGENLSGSSGSMPAVTEPMAAMTGFSTTAPQAAMSGSMAALSEAPARRTLEDQAATQPAADAFSADEKSIEIDIGLLEEDAALRAIPSLPRAETVALVDDDVEVEDLVAQHSAAVRLAVEPVETLPLVDADLTETRDSAESAAVVAPMEANSGVHVDSSDIEMDVLAEEPAVRGPIAVASLPEPAPRMSGSMATPPPTPPPPLKQPPPAPRKSAPRASTQPEVRKSKGKRPWFEEVFDEDYLRTLPFLTPQATQAEARFVVETLAVQPGAQLLDVGCGYGRHAMELAARGFHVVGLDLSLPLLLRGADEAQRRGLSINFIQGDMRELDFDSQFDGAYCLFSTFGYFDDDTNKKTAANIARAIKPGGRVVFEILNRDYVISDLPTRVWWEGDGCVVLEEVEFNYFSSRVQSSRSLVFDDGRQVEQEISVRAYSLHEFGKLLHSAGFRVVEVSGSVHARGRFFGNESRHLIVVAERKAREPASPTGEQRVV